MPVLPLPCLAANFVRETPSWLPARRQRDPRQPAWLPAPQFIAESVGTAARSGERLMRRPATASPAAERSWHARSGDTSGAEAMAHTAASRPATAAQAASAEHLAQPASSSTGAATAPSAAAPGDEDGGLWLVRGRASSYSAPETQHSPAPPPPPRLLVFSGGTAFNSVAGERSMRRSRD